jgi:hypothetical protein
MRAIGGVAILMLGLSSIAGAEEPPPPEDRRPTEGVIVATDVAAASLIEDSSRSLGAAADARLGWTFSGTPSFTPEGTIGFVDFPDAGRLGRAGLGARVTIGDAVQPSLFAHGGAWWNGVTGGPAGDLGLAVDFALPQDLYAGVHGAYNIAWVPLWAESNLAVPYATLGVHLAFAPRAKAARPATRAAAR